MQMLFIYLGSFLACVSPLEDRSKEFPDNKNEDYDKDGLTELQGDCDDLDPDLGLPPTWFADIDNDGFGDPGVSDEGCERPDNMVDNNLDCNDTKGTVYPGSSSEPRVSSILDENGIPKLLCVFDDDGDGYGDPEAPLPYDPGTDCNDADGSVYPAAPEFCDDLDNDCNGEVDDYIGVNAPRWYADADGDGYGNPESVLRACLQPDLYVGNAFDCDDGDASVSPDAREICIDGDVDGDGLDDEIDNNCNGVVDEASAIDASVWYADIDGDGFGDGEASAPGCERPSGYLADSTDCNDNNVLIFPGADEYCNAVDDDCDEEIDEGAALDAPTWYYDGDGDGFGTDGLTQNLCAPVSGYIALGGDCDDQDIGVNPNATEYCNNTDDDCDGDVDEGAIDQFSYFVDSDADGHGSGGEISDCPDFDPVTGFPISPDGYSLLDDDCDDNDPHRAPSLPELCTATVDENCDLDTTLGATNVTVWYADSDGDGQGNPLYSVAVCVQPQYYVGNDLDCNDNDVEVLSGMAPDWELCNGKLDRCEDDDGLLSPPLLEQDLDNDDYVSCTLDVLAPQWEGVGTIVGGDDCDDGDHLVHPGAAEICNGTFEDCSDPDFGVEPAPATETDNDGDGHVECSFDPLSWVGDPSVIWGDDCNDSNANIYVGAASNTPTVCAQDQNNDGDPDCSLTGIHPDYYCETGVFVNTTVGFDFVRVPAGADPFGRYAISYDFYVMTTSVTEEMWDAVMGGNSYSRYPVANVNWHEAAYFSNQVGLLTGAETCYTCTGNYPNQTCHETMDPTTCTGYRLATSAEWELAARSGSTGEFWTGEGPDLGGSVNTNACSPDVRIMDGVSNPLLGDYSWFCGNNTVSGTKVVAQLRPNDFGLYDMQGNVFDWTTDWFGVYPNGYWDPWNSVPIGGRIARGGFFGESPALMTLGFQNTSNIDYFNDNLGLRLVVRAP